MSGWMTKTLWGARFMRKRTYLGRTGVLLQVFLLAGCIAPQPSIIGSPVPPVNLPEASTIDMIEVVFGDKTRRVSDSRRIEGFASFIESLNDGWQDETGNRASGGNAWKIILKSDGQDVVGFGLYAGELSYHVLPASLVHIYGIKELTESEVRRLSLLLDLEDDLPAITGSTSS